MVVAVRVDGELASCSGAAWQRRFDLRVRDHRARLYEQVRSLADLFLTGLGTAEPTALGCAPPIIES